MAIVVESSASADWTGVDDAATKVINKPTGLAVGNLMLAFIGMCDEEATPLACTPPVGWTTFFNDVGNTAAGSNGSLKILCFYKTADSGDAAASDFSFTNTSGEGAGMAGIIYRISGNGSPTHMQYTYDDNNSGGSSQTFADTLTPGFADGYLFFIVCGISSSAEHLHSNYAITTNNPTWVEGADFGTADSLFAYFGAGNGSSPSFAIAHASRPEVTATGNSTVTISNTVSYASGAMVFLPPVVNVSQSPGVVSVATNVIAPAVSGGATVSPAVVTMSTNIIAPTVSSPSDDWTEQTKNSSSWTNQTKN